MENHVHEHQHERLEHDHRHTHDEHHQHTHGFEWDGVSRIVIRMCIRRCGTVMRIFRMCIIGMGIELGGCGGCLAVKQE
jgi:hypothetical protein